MAASSTRFPDIENHWASAFIEGLADKGIITGFPDGSFKPNLPMSRAQFAAILLKAFNRPKKRPNVPFVDVLERHWAKAAISQAYESSFMSGYPGNRFRPDTSIARVEALVALTTGLEISSDQQAIAKAALSQIYQDAMAIPTYATERIATATAEAIIVNHPNPQRLRPLEVATRAEVAAFIYQALVYLEQATPIASEHIVRYPVSSQPQEPQTITIGHRREFRGVWIATVWNIDWPSQKGLSTAQQKSELLQIIDRVADLNFNALIFQVRPTGDALYESPYEPWSEWLTGVQGKAPDPYYDPLEFAIAECHKRNIELHAWFNPYRAGTSSRTAAVRPHVRLTHPEYVYQYGNNLWMEPGAKPIQDLAYNVILDVVNRYDVDGIHLDDYFYPYPISAKAFPDSKTYNAYRAAGGKLSLGDWRRDNVNQMVQRLYKGIKATKKHVKFGISPFGIYRPGQPPQIKGLDQYEALYADPKKWLEEGWLDYAAPQLYWPIDQVAQSYEALLKWWTSVNPKNLHIYAGNNLSALDNKKWVLREYSRQVQLSRTLAPQLSLGNIFYSMKPLKENRFGVVNNFQSELYNELALPPGMPWLDGSSPPIPVEVQGKASKISWKAPARGEIHGWTIYQQTGNSWKLHKILPAATTEVTVPLGTYAVCAVDRTANESAGVVVAVSLI